MRRKEREENNPEVLNEIIRTADVCRIALSNDNIPYIVTMNFGYIADGNGTLYFHCANEGRKLNMIRKNNYVCFEMDTDHNLYNGEKGCDWGMSYSSIVGYGKIEIATGSDDRKKGMDCIMRHYGGDREYGYDDKVLARTTILKLSISEMTGKKC